jgi:dihydroorotate dehydrogenase (NAD+) catalytic subunit
MYKQSLALPLPLMNAAGTLGFVPERNSPLEIERLGAFVTNPISLEPRRAARGTRLVSFPGGFLLHTGFPNPGLRTVQRRFAARWARLPRPVIVHALANTPDEIHRLVLELETLENVTGIELGLPPDVEPETAQAMFTRAQGEMPLIFRLPYENAWLLGQALHAAGAEYVSLSPPRGLLPGPDGRLVSGRLYGPAVLPLVLPVIRALAEMGFTVIGGGGLYNARDAAALRAAGADMLQLDAVLWRGEIPDLQIEMGG